MDVVDEEPGVEAWVGLAGAFVSSFAFISVGLKVMSLKSDPDSFCLQVGQDRCTCHH
jgi:hypothetical protein